MRAIPWIVLFAGCASQPAPKEPAPPAYDEDKQEEGAKIAQDTATPEDFQAVNDEMQHKMDVLYLCYNKELEERMDRSFVGTVTVSIVVGVGGTVKSAEILEDNLDAPKMNQCLIDTIKTFTFKQPRGDVRLDLPIKFEPRY